MYLKDDDLSGDIRIVGHKKKNKKKKMFLPLCLSSEWIRSKACKID